MSIYVGIIVLEELSNKQRYDQTMKELSLFLKTHSAEIDLQIDDKFISFKPIDSLSEINIPQNSSYFRTTYFRISLETPNDEIYHKRFCEIVWECCCIFKENFPSRIELYQENLDQHINIDEIQLNQELLRRQINIFLNKLSLQEKLKIDEVQDIFSVLENSIILQNLKGLKTCLELLESDLCAPCMLQSIGQKEIDMLEGIDNDDGVIKQNFDSELLLKEYQDIRQCCQGILCKILRVKNQLTDQSQNAGANAQNTIIQQLKKFEVINYNQPTFKHSYIFQLRETSDIERVTFILDALMSKNLKLMEDLQQIGLPQVMGLIIEKYSDGEFGIDFSEVTQYCVFHNRLLKYLNRTLETQYSDFLYNDERDGAFSFKLFQILEEGVINILKNTVNLDHREKFEKDLYLQQLVSIYESFLNSERGKLSEQFQFHFKNHLITIKDISTSFLGIQSQDDLSAVSKELKNFYLSITKFSDRIEYAFSKRATHLGGQLNQSHNQYKQSYISQNDESINASHQVSASKNWIQNKRKNSIKQNTIDLPRQANYLNYNNHHDHSNQKSIPNKSAMQDKEYFQQSNPGSAQKYSAEKKQQIESQPGLREQYALQQQSQQQYNNSALSSQQYGRNNLFISKEGNPYRKEYKSNNRNPFLNQYEENEDEDLVKQDSQQY